MLNESLRRRLESLNREPLPASAVREVKREEGAEKKAKRQMPSSAARPGIVAPIPGLVRRGDVVGNSAGEHLLIQLPLETLWPGGETLVDKRREAIGKCTPTDSELSEFIHTDASEMLFLDLETCGLSGSALFLAGVLREIDGQFIVELLLARNYAEEAAVLSSLWSRVRETTVLGTFNGKSFDWPMVQDRTTRHLLFRGRRPPQPKHIDLLHHARRRWRGKFANCKLQTLEERVCGRIRTDDIPGSLIPAAYEQFVRTGFEREMDAILLHNAIDLVTLLDLTMRLAG